MARNGKQGESLLSQATIALARASRCRERFELDNATAAYVEAQQLISSFDALDAAIRDELQGTRARVETERLLVDAILYAHLRDYAENVVRFTTARKQAQRTSPVHHAWVMCCWGATLIFEGAPAAAARALTEAAEIFAGEARYAEQAQARYHLARAHLAKDDRDAAIEILENMTALLSPGLEATFHSTTRYELAAMVLLAKLYRRMFRIKDSRRVLRFAKQSARPMTDFQETPEGKALRFIRRYTLWAYAYWPERPDIPIV